MGAKTAKRFLILIGIVLVVGLFIFFGQRYQVTRMDQSVLARAVQAERDGKFDDAAKLYQEHLEVVPTDQDAKVKLADVLLKGEKNAARQDRAITLYTQFLAGGASVGRTDVRRKLAELLVERGRYQQAQAQLEILLKTDSRRWIASFLAGTMPGGTERAC